MTKTSKQQIAERWVNKLLADAAKAPSPAETEALIEAADRVAARNAVAWESAA